ncbi:hypothetical protein CR513_34909, partial [Mucuna pruriens]
MRTDNSNKLTPILEGPFKVTEEVSKGAYRLEQVDGKRIPRTWNTLNLRLCYSLNQTGRTVIIKKKEDSLNDSTKDKSQRKGHKTRSEAKLLKRPNRETQNAHKKHKARPKAKISESIPKHQVPRRLSQKSRNH